MSDEDEPPEPQADPAQPDPEGEKDYSEQLRGAVNQFNGPIYADSALFGITDRHTDLGRWQGRIDDADVLADLRCFVASDTYEEALRALEKDHVVVLAGDQGVGKRAAAVALLREVTAGALYMLAPSSSPENLAKRHGGYDAGSGYLVVDHKPGQDPADADFTWRTVRDRVREEGAHLVVTTTVRTTRPLEAVQWISWAQPDLRAVLRTRLGRPRDGEAEVDTVLRSLPDGLQLKDLRLRDVVAIADRIAGGKAAGEAIRLLDPALHHQVRAWFDEDHDAYEYLALAALSFMHGTRQRILESAITKLEERVAEAVRGPEPDTELKPPAELLSQKRRRLYAPESLIKIEQAGSDGVARPLLFFKEQRYRRFVLAELWAREEAAFWDGVRAWLDEVMPVEGLRVAIGLAELARYTFDEVEDILRPWANGAKGWPGQTTAAYVLWLMSYDETLAPEALHLATRWAIAGSPAQRWTGAVAFSGELGARYPHEAANQLWQLIMQSHTVTGEVPSALGGLFARLANRSEDARDAGIVLTLLDAKLTRLARPGAKPEYATAAVRAILGVLSARHTRSGCSASFAYLCAMPQKAGVLGRLWSAVLRNRPTRRYALTLLRNGLDDLKKLCPDPVAAATSLGRAISDALPPGEPEQLRRDFAALEARHRKDSSPLVEHLLAAIDRLHREAEKPE